MNKPFYSNYIQKTNYNATFGRADASIDLLNIVIFISASDVVDVSKNFTYASGERNEHSKDVPG